MSSKKRKSPPQESLTSYFEKSSKSSKKYGSQNKDSDSSSTCLQQKIEIQWSITDSLYIAKYGKLKKTKKFIAFDLDGTLIKTKSGRVFSKDAADWTWWHPSVVPKLKALYQDNYSLVIFSNQNGIPRKPSAGHTFQMKIRAIFESLDLPIVLYAAILKDKFRKPLTGMWNSFLKDVNRSIDLSFIKYVGDAAGRPGDHNSTDLKFAENIGIKFETPEQFFLGHSFVPPNFESFHPKNYLVRNSSSHPYHFKKSEHQEIVVLVGFPSSGKSTLAESQIVTQGYERVNQDILKTKSKCIKAAIEALKKEKSVVIDNTNPTIESRKMWIDIAQEFEIPIRCIHLQSSEELARHNNVFRYIHHNQKQLPEIAFNSFKSRFQMPTVEEGFTNVEEVPFKCLKDYEDTWNYWYE
ncbi:DNA kinase/phosphatase Pnk1 [Schizosaccharomyces pombe]|uniref:Bifunctional polynucleotide phosphatase/kinase n=1 Tax=Schizosaccharomyces pombe (strain 972 / ATCC 24843) TaxID=284812 RepID=PNK1_SCHPO|nr:DNA kinase/phosphatase Pnk1 [Schizosaccharomyces pombe]O13911.2 RecName: Full=Bifunctional polynucleotide phosphatase/kinase; AltName: Full=DNA 5'-kinase/3'-phosphatase; AltName: Full=Polynucleotide kinase-3'-phosphatase; Includes: RecName: Full=Polynucleotide 3'-phosphatase; AltName: Full=2'(3')-polynucleotidase; Includes: RecName: Full=Polynucleotide 5'-hydroxyl-kinase [Schizosaccharomyces pombe 972h-]CAB11157.2 DNA kinase/phosphatase Pnk1 [Schizosaccharomyces pombe]|eukprot:NP_593635.2 DNA kinase/phosphatase Pnk1 [Schizosaccharomyces pombe]